MSTRTWSVMLLLVPALAAAQRGGSRTRGDTRANWDEVGSGSRASVKLSRKDLENIDPLKVLIDERKDLKLTDDQLRQLRTMDDSVKVALEPSFRGADSLLGILKRSGDASNDTVQLQRTLARQELLTLMGAVRAQYDTSFQRVLPVLDDAQKAKATEIVEKHDAEAKDEIREKLGGGARPQGRGGDRPSRGRPPAG
jgi:hypothetical protein